MNQRLFVENWEIMNSANENRKLKIGNTEYKTELKGHKGTYTNHVYSNANDEVILKKGEAYNFSIFFSAAIDDEPINGFDYKIIEQERNDFLYTVKNNLVLESSSNVLNQLFYFSKIRAADEYF
ncbi:MAG: hypothetical protein HC906_16500 [Bacteroidales bacterium]|nr:hypothetical protein [Bacteroidales bacterium]